MKKLTISEFKSLIKEEAQKLHKRAILESEKKKLMEELGMMEDDNEMWNRDASHGDTYGDTDYIDNWEKGGGPDEEELPTATIKYKLVKYGTADGIKEYNKPFELYCNENDEYYDNFILYKSKQGFDNGFKTLRGMTIEGVFEIEGDDTYMYAIALPYKPSKGEDFGGM